LSNYQIAENLLRAVHDEKLLFDDVLNDVNEFLNQLRQNSLINWEEENEIDV
jgi:hypothetical protein